jgi:hypothetical protein
MNTTASIPQESTGLAKVEAVLEGEVTTIEQTANELTVDCESSYEYAASFGRDVKRAADKVTAYFEPDKKRAHQLHASLCAKEKELLKPLQNAEATLKLKMGEYVQKVEQERKAAEEEARRIAQEEAERKLQEAVAHEESGDEEAAASALADAQMADTVSRNIAIPQSTPKVTGVSHSKDWEIVSVNSANVPIALSGMMIRPVDEKVVLRLIRASKGKIEIPGITYKEIPKISMRK